MKALVTGATGFVGSAVARALAQRAGKSECWSAMVPTAAICRGLRSTSSWGTSRMSHRSMAPLPIAKRCSMSLRTTGLERSSRPGFIKPMWKGRAISSAPPAGRELHASFIRAVSPQSAYRRRLARQRGNTGRARGHGRPLQAVEVPAEQLVRDAAQTGVPVIIVNPSTPIGPGDVKPTPTGRIVLDAASGRMPAYVDTGLNVVHVDDVAAGHLLAFDRGRVGERYILGGEDMTLREILAEIARLSGRRPPRIRVPHSVVLPLAYASEAFARVTGRTTRITVEGVLMARKHMFFSSEKAVRELGYRWRAPPQAFADAVRWFREQGLLG